MHKMRYNLLYNIPSCNTDIICYTKIIERQNNNDGQPQGRRETKMKRELTPQAMVMLEQQAKAKIKKCNEQIRKNTEVYNNWESVTDERLLRYTREQYKEKFIDYWRDERRYHVDRLNNQIRKGFVFE